MTRTKKIVEELRKQRQETGITLTSMSKYLNLSTGHLANIEAGRKGLSLEYLIKYCQMLPEARLMNVRALIFGD